MRRTGHAFVTKAHQMAGEYKEETAKAHYLLLGVVNDRTDKRVEALVIVNKPL